MTRSSQGFSLIELLVVVAIIGVLVGLLIPAAQLVRESANRVQCTSNMRQVGIAFHNYWEVYGRLPTSSQWVLRLAECLEGKQENNERLTGIERFQCNSRSGGPYRVDFAACETIGVLRFGSLDGIFSFANIPDGSSNTILLGEKSSLAVMPTMTFPYPAVRVHDTTGLSSNYVRASYEGFASVIGDKAQRDTNKNYERIVVDLNDRPSFRFFAQYGTYRYEAVGSAGAPNVVEAHMPDSFHQLGFGSAHLRSMNVLLCDGSVQMHGYNTTGLTSWFNPTDISTAPPAPPPPPPPPPVGEIEA